MLFHCYWREDWPTLVVEGNDGVSVAAVAAEYNGGVTPDLVTPLRDDAAAVVVCEVHFDAPDASDVPEGEDPDAFDIVTADLPEDLEDVLIRLEEVGAGDGAEEDEEEDECAAVAGGLCRDTMQEDEGGPVLTCTLHAHDTGDHIGLSPGGELVSWPQEDEG